MSRGIGWMWYNLGVSENAGTSETIRMCILVDQVVVVNSSRSELAMLFNDTVFLIPYNSLE